MTTKITVYKRYNNSPGNTKIIEGQITNDDSIPVEVQLADAESTGQTYPFNCPWCNKTYIAHGQAVSLILDCVKCSKPMIVAIEGTGEVEQEKPASTTTSSPSVQSVEESKSPSTQDGILCSACGHNNPSWRSECEQCKTKLVSSSGQPISISLRERPGCVTAYAILLAIGASAIGIWGLASGMSMIGNRYYSGSGGFMLIIITGLFAIFEFLIARGLWQQKNWARNALIVVQSLGMLGNVIIFLSTLTSRSSSASSTLFGAVIGLAIGGVIINWFVSHGEYFH